ncbi:MAG: SCP2 sterol-binding domain-containing protein [Lysobacterales bacterium]
MRLPHPALLPLLPARDLIDRIDDGLLVLVGARRRVVAGLAGFKRRAGIAACDPLREQAVLGRAERVAAGLDLPPGLAQALIGLLIADARAAQGIAPSAIESASVESAMNLTPLSHRSGSVSPEPDRHRLGALLALLPPPVRLEPLLRLLPRAVQARAIEFAIARVLARPLANGDLDFMQGRRIGIEVSDLGLAWVIEWHQQRLRVCPPGTVAEASVRGSATDLLLLTSRLEDADALFFQRRLELTGDTELGLTARNLLDALPWEDVPLGLRIVLHRAAQLARAARAAHRERSTAAP